MDQLCPSFDKHISLWMTLQLYMLQPQVYYTWKIVYKKPFYRESSFTKNIKIKTEGDIPKCLKLWEKTITFLFVIHKLGFLLQRCKMVSK